MSAGEIVAGMSLAEASSMVAWLRGRAFTVTDPIGLADGSFIVGVRTSRGPWVHMFDASDHEVLEFVGLLGS